METDLIANAENKRATRLMVLCCLVYTFAYIAKYGYTSSIVAIISYYGVTRAKAGIVSTVFFVAYGSSQIIHGILCKHYNKKFVVTFALLVSGLINVIVFMGIPFNLLIVLWGINGFIQSVLWPCMLLTLSQSLSPEKTTKATVVLGFSTTGASAAYALSAFFVAVLNFRYTFLTSGAMLIAIGVIWFFSYNRLTGEKRYFDETKNENKNEIKIGKEKNKIPASVLGVLIFLGGYAVIASFIKDGLNIWVPNILKENYGLSESFSILLTVALSATSFLGTMFAALMYKKIKDFTLLTTVFFAMAAVLVFAIIKMFNLPTWYIVVFVFCLISLLAHSMAYTVTNLAPMKLGGKNNVGMLGGFMNGLTYIGSSISSYGLGAFADAKGWLGVMYLFLIVCVMSVFLEAVYLVVRSIVKKKQAGKEC